MPEPLDLSIIIINYNTARLTIDCLTSIIKNINHLSYEIVLIDNGSDIKDFNNVKAFAKKFPQIKLVGNKKNFGFSKANNQGMKHSRGKHLLFLNSDTILKSDVVSPLLKWMESHPRAGIVSCQLYNADGSVQGTGGYFPTFSKVLLWMLMLDDIPFFERLIKPFHPAHKYKANAGNLPSSPTSYDWITGAFMLVRREVADEITGFDEDYFMYVEDVDYCYRAKKASWEVWLLPEYGITHLGGSSSKTEFPLLSEFNNLRLFYKKHMPRWQGRILPLLFKIGILQRAVILGILKGPQTGKLYVKTFKLI